jgi:hypothetical protein
MLNKFNFNIYDNPDKINTAEYQYSENAMENTLTLLAVEEYNL